MACNPLDSIGITLMHKTSKNTEIAAEIQEERNEIEAETLNHLQKFTFSNEAAGTLSLLRHSAHANPTH